MDDKEEAAMDTPEGIQADKEYVYNSALAWPSYMNGAHVKVTRIFEGEGLTVAYDFHADDGTSGSGTMRMDHARSVLKPVSEVLGKRQI